MVKTLIDIGKIITFTILTALLGSSLAACKQNEVISMENNVSTMVIQSILDHNETQQYLHPEIENRRPIRIVTNNLIPTNITINKFDKPVLLLDKASTDPYLEIITFKHNSDYVEFFIRYDVEGVSISGKASVKGDKVTLTVFDVVEN